MSLARWSKRRDANEADIVLTARFLGAKLWPLDTPCDYLMLWCGRWHAIEVKTPKGKFTRAQLEFRRDVDQAGGRLIVWRQLADVAETLNALRLESLKRAVL